MPNNGEVIVKQPRSEGNPSSEGGWMTAPQGYNGCPPGLEYLTAIDTILIQQRKEILEIVANWEGANKYVLRNDRGEQVFYAFEESGTCERVCFGPKRGYTIHIVDNNNREVMTVRKEFKCCAVCCWCANIGCCQQESTIEAPPGVLIGTVQQRSSSCVSAFNIFDANGQKIFEIDGAGCCTMCGCGKKEFPIFTLDGHEIGAITKVWGGLVKEVFTRADTFGVKFPMNLDVKMKAALIGATFLLDFMEFEKRQNNKAANNRS